MTDNEQAIAEIWNQRIISITGTDYIEIKVVFPTWTTNPTINEFVSQEEWEVEDD